MFNAYQLMALPEQMLEAFWRNWSILGIQAHKKGFQTSPNLFLRKMGLILYLFQIWLTQV